MVDGKQWHGRSLEIHARWLKSCCKPTGTARKRKHKSEGHSILASFFFCAELKRESTCSFGKKVLGAFNYRNKKSPKSPKHTHHHVYKISVI